MSPVLSKKKTIEVEQGKGTEERFHRVVEAAPNALVVINQHKDIFIVNSQAERLFGYQKQELMGKSIEVLIPERLRRYYLESVCHFFQAPSVRFMGSAWNLSGVRKDGTEFPLEVGLNPFTTDEGMFVLVSIIDITARKNAEELIKKLSQIFELTTNKKAGWMKDEFISMVSHELRTPLTSIRASLELIAGGTAGEIPIKLKSMFQIAHANCERLVRLINDIIDTEH